MPTRAEATTREAAVPASTAGALRSSFPCTQCGACCRQVHLANETRHMDRGDGACRYYDDTAKVCLIYESRPSICRVDQFYEQHFVRIYSWDAFVEMNVRACRHLADLETRNATQPDW